MGRKSFTRTTPVDVLGLAPRARFAARQNRGDQVVPENTAGVKRNTGAASRPTFLDRFRQRR